MRSGVFIVLVAGCAFQVRANGTDDAPVGGDGPGSGTGSDASTPDAAIDAMVDAAVDATPLLPCPPAPTGCTSFTCSPTACHYLCTDKRSWSSAQGKCASLGLGCLATIDDAAENTCITTNTLPVFGVGTAPWFGWVQTAGASEPGGGWHWQCGTSTYVSPAWGQFEPTNTGGNEDCGMFVDGGGWIDADCSTNARYVCELSRLP